MARVGEDEDHRLGWHRRSLVIVLLASAAGLVACGDGRNQPEAQPSTDEPRFTEGRFDQLPRVPGTDPVGERSEEDDVVAQSFRVRNRTPAQVMDFYRSRLRGWELVGRVEELGVDTYRGTWRRQNEELVVSTTPGPTLSPEGEVASQYSLSLHVR